jgi:sarcosine oxidase subunit gamma
VTVDPHHLSAPGPAHLRRTALAHRAADLAAVSGDAVTLTEAPRRAMVNLRVTPGPDAAPAVEAALGTALPAPNTVATTPDGRDVLWLGPDEFLVVAGDGEAATLTALPARTVDVSAARAGVDVRGERARDLLATGCSLDLHPAAFPPGSCAQTLLARANVLIHHRDDGYRVLTGPSFAGYLADWLVDAAAEYSPG